MSCIDAFFHIANSLFINLVFANVDLGGLH